MDLLQERTIALAGIIQACNQVQKLARHGSCDDGDFDTCIQSILVLDAVNTPSVYGGLAGVRTGLTLMARGIMNSGELMDTEMLRYAVSILHLQTQLVRDADKFQRFGQEVERLSGYAQENLITACSDVYQTHISSMRPQIIVQGEANHLQDQAVPAKIRALLLAALRSAVLWQQKDGGRFKLLWQRSRMQNVAKQLLQSIAVH